MCINISLDNDKIRNSQPKGIKEELHPKNIFTKYATRNKETSV